MNIIDMIETSCWSLELGRYWNGPRGPSQHSIATFCLNGSMAARFGRRFASAVAVVGLEDLAGPGDRGLDEEGMME
jgi:hypothetical protein